MAKGVINYWPSILLTIVLLIGIAACFRRLDNLVVDEVRALISVLFGFATTCLFLSYIWLIQRKPLLSRTWPNQTFPMGVDVLSMHPRGRTDSLDSSHLIDIPIRTISSCVHDKPPTYEDALVNSKPINWEEKCSPNGNGAIVVDSSCYCTCVQSSPVASTTTTTTSVQSNAGDQIRIEENPTTTKDIKQIFCPQCSRILPSMLLSVKNQQTQPDKLTAAKLDGFGRLPHANQYLGSNGEANRKASYTQLDVSQLMNLSSSPPKYSDLLHHHQHHQKFNPS